MENNAFFNLAQSFDWEKRLNREMPFIIAEIDKTDGKYICDLGGGIGKHSLYLQEYGYDVVLIDRDVESLNLAKKIGIGKIISAEFLNFNKHVSGLDFIFTIGNGLSSLKANELKEFAEISYSCLKAKGRILVQILNYDALIQMNNFIISSRVDDNIFHLRFIEPYDNEKMEFHYVETELDSLETNITKKYFNILLKDDLQNAFLEAGFQEITFYSDYSGNPYDQNTGRDTIFVAVK